MSAPAATVALTGGPCPARGGVRPGRYRWRHAVGLVTLSLAAGCASPPSAGPDAGPGHWTGRFALVLTEPGIEQRQEEAQGRFALDVHGTHSRLEVFSPFGQTLAQLDDQPGQARLATSDGRILEAASPDVLLEQTLGWHLPVAALPAWLEAREGQAPAARPGWQVRIVRRFDDGRPRILEAQWPEPPRPGERELRVRIVVDAR